MQCNLSLVHYIFNVPESFREQKLREAKARRKRNRRMEELQLTKKSPSVSLPLVDGFFCLHAKFWTAIRAENENDANRNRRDSYVEDINEW